MSKLVILFLFFFQTAVQASVLIPSCEVDNPKVGSWVMRSPNDGLSPEYTDPCNPPKGEIFRVSVSTNGCGFVVGESCPNCDFFRCPIGNDINGTLKSFCDYYIINSNCGIPPVYENGCCKLDMRGSNQCDEDIRWMTASFSQFAVQVLQWKCLDQCLDDPNKTDPGQCGCGIPDIDTDGDGLPNCFKDEQNLGSPPC